MLNRKKFVTINCKDMENRRKRTHLEIFQENFEENGISKGQVLEYLLKEETKLFEIEKGGSGGERPLVEGSRSVHMADRINKKREKPFISANAL